MTFKEKYGEYALISGGSSGIGLEIAKNLASKGLNLVLVARGQKELKSAAETIKTTYKIDVQTIAADISTESGIELVKKESDNLQIGLLVLAAGLEVNGAFEKNNIEKEIAVVNLNILSTLKLSHYFIAKMLPRKNGGLMLLASLSGHMPNPYFANYAGTKSYILNFGASLYGELKPKGIDVTILSPGLTKTSMIKDNGVDFSKTPMTAMNPSDVAETGVNALGKKLIAIPGFKNRIMAFMGKHLPIQMQSKMNEKMMRKAINPSKI